MCNWKQAGLSILLGFYGLEGVCGFWKRGAPHPQPPRELKSCGMESWDAAAVTGAQAGGCWRCMSSPINKSAESVSSSEMPEQEKASGTPRGAGTRQSHSCLWPASGAGKARHALGTDLCSTALCSLTPGQHPAATPRTQTLPIESTP